MDNHIQMVVAYLSGFIDCQLIDKLGYMDPEPCINLHPSPPPTPLNTHDIQSRVSSMLQNSCITQSPDTTDT